MKHFGFLRAINVGGRTVRMETLRELFADLGATNVETFIASGNVIFETRSRGGRPLEARIEAHLRASLGYDVATFLRTADELRAIARHPAFEPADAVGGTVYVTFVGSPVSRAAVAAVAALRSASDDFHVNGREIYWLRRNRDSAFTGNGLEKAIGMPGTMRNMNTVHRMVAKYARPGPRNEV
jgi:uncharacterized protein (DUF1697 family)